MVYLDNGATSYPKPASVLRSTKKALKNCSFNTGRSGYKEAIESAEKIFKVRKSVAEFFGGNTENVIFTKNCTESLNIAIKGSVKRGEHIVISSLEHNSSYRVVHKLYLNDYITYSIFDFSFEEEELLENFKESLKDNTTLVVCTNCSNVFGSVLPVRKIGEICKERGITFVLDAAGSAGGLDIDIKRDNIDILCASGHKGLYGAMGTGIMVLADGVKLDTLIEGGTGSASLLPVQPLYTPDRFEAGTLNNPGIISLGAGIDFINKKGRENIYKKEIELLTFAYDMLSLTDGVMLYTPKPEINKTSAVLALNFKDLSSEKTASLLAKENICTRAGFHCSPLSHKTFGTIERGTVRISFGAFNKKSDVLKLIRALRKIK